LGHISEKGLWALKNKNIDGLNECSLQFDFCEHFKYGKKNHAHFYSSSHKSCGLLGLIYSNVFGRVKVPSISKALYYVSFIDDYSRTWVYFLRTKSKVLSQFDFFFNMS
jgi:hypothetical protein